MIFADRFADRVMVVTGAAQGIGLAVARRAVAEGARVLLVDRAEHVADVARDLGDHASGLCADLEVYDDAAAAIDAALQRFDRIDVLINNVGGAIRMRPFDAFEPAQIEAEITRSLLPTLWCCHAAIAPMLAQGGGTIVNVSSNAMRGIYRVPYAAAKGGVNGITQSLAMEYAGRGIRVVATAPGGTAAPPRRTPRGEDTLTPQEIGWMADVVDQVTQSSFMKRYATLDEQAGAILFLASDEASYITGTTLPVTGGDIG